MVDKKQMQDLAQRRILDAKILLDAGSWSAAYYLAGYAVECALKACILTYLETNLGVLFEDRKYLEKCWTHDPEVLLIAADLMTERDADKAANSVRAKNWLTVKDWREVARYQEKIEPEARALYEAITDPTDGVLPWIKARW